MMDIRNRMDDVVTMRCHVCQEYLSLKIRTTDWQKKLYKKAKYAIDNKYIYASSYASAYEKMRDYGIEKYSIEDMDVTIISAVICHELALVYKSQDETMTAIKALRNDRNIADHSGKNEEPEELYLRGLMDLQDLKDFVRTVDKYETRISDETRQQFRLRYIQSIDNLMAILDDERIELVQRKKERKKNIQKVLESKDPFGTWNTLYELYDNKSRINGDFDELETLIFEAAAAGIEQAYPSAAERYYNDKNYNEAEKYLSLMFNNKTTRLQNPKQMMMLAKICFIKKRIHEGNEILDTLIKGGINIKKSKDGTHCSLLSNTTNMCIITIDIPPEEDIKKNGLTVGGVSGRRKVRLGRIHKKTDSTNKQDTNT